MKPYKTNFLRNFKFENKITLTYLIFGFLWILLSDEMLDLLVSDDSLLTKFQSYKGSFFILVTAFFLYLFVKRHMYNLRIVESQRIESESHYKALFKNNLSIILLVNPETGLINDANQAACNYYGYTHTEICKKTIYEINISDPRKINTSLEAVVAEIQNHFEFQHRLANGEIRDVEVFTGPIRLGNKTLIYSHVHDITVQKLADEKIKKKDQEFRKLSGNVSGLIFQFTRKPDGTYFVPIASEGIRNIFGCSPEDVVADFGPIGRVIYPEDAERVIRDIEYSAEHLTYFTCEFRVQIPGREIQWIYSQSTPERLPDGSVTWYGFNTDITQRKKIEEALKESEERFRDILFSTSDWVWEVDENGKYTYSSQRDMDLFDVAPDEIIGKTPFDFMPADEADRISTIFSEIKANKEPIKDLENWNIGKDGEMICLLTNGLPILDNDGNLKGYRGVDKNITERKHAEQELITAKERAEASDKLKTAFMNNITHEIRTPLNGILGFGQIIADPDFPMEEKEPFFKMLNDSSDRLLNTITSIMDISLLTSRNQKVYKKEFPIDKLINEVGEKFKIRCEEKNLKLSLDKGKIENDAKICSDESLLGKIISHLMDNAIKFTSGGTITIGYEMKEKELLVYVKDTGIGISDKYKGQIFDNFMQVDNANTRRYEGSGIGLSISKKITNLLGGKIWFESVKGKGTTFFFTIPIVCKNGK
jgi:PAS domain S-box-containing protein